MARKEADDDEGSAVVGVEGVDIVTRTKRVRHREDFHGAAPRPFAETLFSTTTFFTTLLSSFLQEPIDRGQQENNATGSANASFWYSGHEDFLEDQATMAKTTPALYAIVSALGASFAYLMLFLTRCKGLLDELAPKKQFSDLLLSHTDRHRRQRPRLKKGQGSTTRLCSSLFGKFDTSAATVQQA
jgi:hypothetical protein